MVEIAVSDGVEHLIERADVLVAEGHVREAIDVLREANRRERSPAIDRALVRIRRDGCSSLPQPVPPVGWQPVVATVGDGEVFEIGPDELNLDSFRTGLARSGCVLVRGLVPPERVATMVAGIDAALGAYDATQSEEAVPATDWFTPFPMPDRISPAGAGGAVMTTSGGPPASNIPERAHRKFVRAAGGLWTVDSPPMLFELLELVEDLGVGSLMTEYFGERPFLSANKCTLRRVPLDEVTGGWHQDGAFLGDDVRAFNFWVALTACGRDAPGLDVVPKRFDQVLKSGEDAFFEWSLSDAAVHLAAAGTPIVRADFEAGDALLFDHRLVHRTATSPEMTRERHALESWFFAPSAFPASQLPIIY